MPLSQIGNIILVLSGKGGVGKSSVTTQLALSFCLAGYNVGVLDLDITGPNAPRFFGIEEERVTQTFAGMGAVLVHDALSLPPSSLSSSTPASSLSASSPKQQRGSLAVMSLGFILPSRSYAVIWRSPKRSAMVKQFLVDTAWPAAAPQPDGASDSDNSRPTSKEIDILLIDTPPGTTDEHIQALQTIHELAGGQLRGAVLVSTPQAVATADVRKELSFCDKTATRVLGIVENMSGFVCPHCAECTNIFSSGGGEVLAQEYGVPFLGRVPIDPMWGRLVEEGIRPEYPEGTIIDGINLKEQAQSWNQSSGDKDDRLEELLVEKYKCCSLAPVFAKMVEQLKSEIK